MKKLVYVTGAYTHPDPVMNVRLAVFFGNQLLEQGYVPLVPHLSMLWHTISPKPIEDWYAYDIDLMRRCDVVFRFSGESVGADREVEAARTLGIPVVFSLAELNLLVRVA